MFWKIISATAVEPTLNKIEIEVRETQESPNVKIILGIVVPSTHTADQVKAACQSLVDGHVSGWAEEKARADAIAAAQQSAESLLGISGPV